MPYKEKRVEKLYYSIGEVSTLFNVNQSLIRFWEREFEVLKPKKNKKGNRLFTKDDLENLKVIYHLVKEKGYTLEGAKKELRSNKNVNKKNAEILNSLTKMKQILQEIQAEL